MSDKMDKLRDQEEALWFQQGEVLRRAGWVHTCDIPPRTPGLTWLWQATLPDGRTVLVHMATALCIEGRLDDDEERVIQIPAHRLKILRGVHVERVAQDRKHGGREHDDTHTIDDWAQYVTEHMQRAVHGTPMECRHELEKVAALAVAAIESHDRKQARERKR